MKTPTDKRMSFTMDRLIDQIIDGRKTASADWLHDQGELDEWDSALVVGDFYTVCDSKRIPRCVIRITMMALCRWTDIPEWLWRGETNDCPQEFRDDHIEYFNDPTDDFEFVGYEFELVEVIASEEPQPSDK
ncbi:MAG: ASCH domain-containing protein [Verrucomicrobiota bacterium]